MSDATNLSFAGPLRLAGAGLVLREWEPQDAGSMVELFDDPDIGLRTPLPSPFTLADAHERLVRARDEDRLLLAITTDGTQPLGEVILLTSGELGYMVGSQHRGRDLAARALGLLRDYAHDTLGLAVLRLRIEADNAPSRAVALRAGFRKLDATAQRVENKGRHYTVDLWEHGQS